MSAGGRAQEINSKSDFKQSGRQKRECRCIPPQGGTDIYMTMSAQAMDWNGVSTPWREAEKPGLECGGTAWCGEGRRQRGGVFPGRIAVGRFEIQSPSLVLHPSPPPAD